MNRAKLPGLNTVENGLDAQPIVKSGEAIYISPVSSGLGDLIVSLPAVQALIDSNQPTYLVVRCNEHLALAERIPGLQGAVCESEFLSSELCGRSLYVNLREHPAQTTYWWGSPECDQAFRGYRINDFLKIICQDFGLDANFDRLKPLKFKQIPKMQGIVVFLPGSAGLYKCWPKERWVQLSKRLEEHRVDVVMLGEPDQSEAVKELLPYLRWCPTPCLTDALDVLSSAKAVVAVDTGLMHLAVQQAIPTMALYRSHPIYVRELPNSLSLVARPCFSSCIQASLECTYNSLTDLSSYQFKTWQCQAPAQESCMSSISTERVFAEMLKHHDLFLCQSRGH